MKKSSIYIYENIDKHLLVISSTLRNRSQVTINGIMNRKADKALCKVISVTGHILKVTFAGNPELTVLRAYLPIQYNAVKS